MVLVFSAIAIVVAVLAVTRMAASRRRLRDDMNGEYDGPEFAQDGLYGDTQAGEFSS